jgi:hypothetical protein
MSSSQPAQQVPRKLPDLHRSAFWIYGATATVMREPMGAVLRHAFEAGMHDWQARLEVLRLAIVILVLSRLFLVVGLYFEMVFMQPDASVRYPRRSYPVDFLTGIMHFMAGAALTTVMSNHLRMPGGLAMFSWILIAFFSIDILWFGVAVARRFSRWFGAGRGWQGRIPCSPISQRWGWSG